MVDKHWQSHLAAEGRNLAHDLEEGHYSVSDAAAMIRKLANALEGISPDDIVAAREGFKIGDPVWVYDRGKTTETGAYRRRPRAPATIAGFLDDVYGGVTLDQRVHGFHCWNVADLKPRKDAA